MLVRRYRGKSFEQALDRVKADLGREATILTKRTVRRGLLSSDLELTAALTSQHVPNAPKPSTAAVPTQTQKASVVHRAQGRSGSMLRRPKKKLRARVSKARVTRTLPRARAYQHARHLQDEIRDILRAVERVVAKSDRFISENKRPPIGGEVAKLFSLVRDLHSTLDTKGGTINEHASSRSDSANRAENAGALEENPVLRGLEERLVRSEMSAASVADIMGNIAGLLPSDPEIAAACAPSIGAKFLQAKLKCRAPIDEHSANIVALVGPPGVGKTAMLAKIVTRAALVHHRKVAIVGTDLERVGAPQALLLMARAIGVSCEIAGSERALAHAVEDLRSADLIVIDTSGVSVRDHHAISELNSLVASVKAECHLVLAADARRPELLQQIAAYEALSPVSLSFTRIDQAVGQGAIYDAVRVSDLPTMYLSAGRKIPEDLESVTPERLAGLILDFHYN